MSNISGVHDVVLYTGKNKPLSGQRLSVIGFKTDKSKSEKLQDDGTPNPTFDPAYKRPDARCVSLPKLEISVTPQILKDALLEALEDLQDSVVRKIVVAQIEEGKNVITIMDAQISFEAIAEFAKLEAANGKLNKQLIEDWFDSDVGDALTLALANAMKLGDKPTPDQEKALATAVTKYKETFQSLAAPKAGLSLKIANQLEKVLGVAENKEHRVYRALSQKIINAKTQKDPELIGL